MPDKSLLELKFVYHLQDGPVTSKFDTSSQYLNSILCVSAIQVIQTTMAYMNFFFLISQKVLIHTLCPGSKTELFSICFGFCLFVCC